MFFFFQASLTALSASWNVQDPESGVEHIKFTAYTKLGGRTTVIYPSRLVTQRWMPKFTVSELLAQIEEQQYSPTCMMKNKFEQ